MYICIYTCICVCMSDILELFARSWKLHVPIEFKEIRSPELTHPVTMIVCQWMQCLGHRDAQLLLSLPYSPQGWLIGSL